VADAGEISMQVDVPGLAEGLERAETARQLGSFKRLALHAAVTMLAIYMLTVVQPWARWWVLAFLWSGVTIPEFIISVTDELSVRRERSKKP
jgi:hypothetical protein